MQTKYLTIDLETTGLNVDECQIIEIGAIVDDLAQPQVPISSLPRFHCYIEREMYTGQPYALSLHSEIFKRIASKAPGYRIVSPDDMASDLAWFLEANFADGEHITAAGKNFGTFDRNFLLKEPKFTANGGELFLGKFKVRHRVIDPTIMFWIPKQDGVQLPSTETVCKRAGIPYSNKHDAIGDCEMVIAAVRKHVEVLG